jgi:hypothetical protein
MSLPRLVRPESKHANIRTKIRKEPPLTPGSTRSGGSIRYHSDHGLDSGAQLNQAGVRINGKGVSWVQADELDDDFLAIKMPPVSASALADRSQYEVRAPGQGYRRPEAPTEQPHQRARYPRGRENPGNPVESAVNQCDHVATKPPVGLAASRAGNVELCNGAIPRNRR